MKNKNSKHYITVHQRLEYFFRHRIVLLAVLGVMAVAIIKYQTKVVGLVQQVYMGHGVGVLSTYTHSQEITRMPVTYGTSKVVTISGE